MKFEKWTALGNDYIIIEAGELPWELTPERIRRICDSHFGVSSDGILLLSTPGPGESHVAELRIFNPDGSEAELSGNGAREAVLYLRNAGWTDEDEFTVLTKAGIVRPLITSPTGAAMDIGRAATTSADYPGGAEDGRGTLQAAGREWNFRHVNVGNPQCVIEVGDDAELEALDLQAIGPGIEANPLFPNRSNVSFVVIGDPGEAGGSGGPGPTVRARIFERGVGETMASGTGASGAAVHAFLGGASSPVTVELEGGRLTVEIGEDLEMRLIGEASPIYSGELAPGFLETLR